ITKKAVEEGAEQTDQAKATIEEAEVPTPNNTSNNVKGFHKRMVNHLTSSIKSHNRVISKMHLEVRVIYHICDREITLRNDLQH
ncbi:hypothetical protein J1N35_019305, partial [Gossypium stocksii]